MRLDSLQMLDKTTMRQEYSCFLATVGYETRSRFIAEDCGIEAERCVAIGYADRQSLSYHANKAWYTGAKYSFLEPTEATYASVIEDTLSRLDYDDKGTFLCLDVSSLTRHRIATCVDLLRTASRSYGPITVDFLYAPAQYSSPATDNSPNHEVGPLPGFSGWAPPGKHSMAVVGVGYERNKALGAVRYIDPDEVWAYAPTGHEQRYTDAIQEANEHLWSIVPKERCVQYNVFHPFENFVDLESFSCGALRSSKLTLLPFGPKIFALNCLLVSCLHPEIAVWRVSSGHHSEPSDRLPNGEVVGIRARFVHDAESDVTLPLTNL